MTIAKSLYFGRNKKKPGYRHRVHRSKKGRHKFNNDNYYSSGLRSIKAQAEKKRLTPAEKKKIFDQIVKTRPLVNTRALPKPARRARVSAMPDYPNIALSARAKVLDMIYKAQSSHIGSNFSSIDILSVLFEKMNLNQDELVVSKGWIAASIYYFLAEKGVIPKEDLERYCAEDEHEYIGLVEPRGKFALRAAGGSMGFGLPFAVGFALAKKLKGEEGTVYCLMSDGEQAIGTTWEAALLAAHHKLDNLVVLVDINGLQAMGPTEKVLNLGDLVAKWKAFEWNVGNLPDGHSFKSLDFEIEAARRITDDPVNYYHGTSPRILLCHTIKGKGVSFMEGNNLYHYKNLTSEEYENAKKEL